MPKTASFREEDDDGKPTHGIMSFLRLPGVMVATFALAVMASSIGFLGATLEPHLRRVRTQAETLKNQDDEYVIDLI